MRLTVPITGLTSLDSARQAESVLRGLPGVRRAKVSYPTGRATISADETVNALALRTEVARALQAAGYQVAERTASGESPGVALGPTPPVPRAEGSVASEGARAVDRRPPGRGREHYDLLVIGSGGAGMAAVIRASELGARSALVEAAGVIGGTCVNLGCVPSKHLVEAAHHYYTARARYPAGIAAGTPGLAWDELRRARQAVIERMREEKYVDVLKAYQDITLLRGRATFDPAGERTGRGVQLQVGDRPVRAGKVIIATGTVPALPPISGLAHVGALDSTSAMELEHLPASLLVVGGGSTGLELGQAFARLGVRVTALEAADRILPAEDSEVSAALTDALAAEGIDIRTGAAITAAFRHANGVTLTYQRGGVQSAVQAAQVLVATGRRPSTAELNLQVIGVRTDSRGFITTDEFMRTSHPAIYAAGDVTGGPGYVYVAALQGGLAAQAALAPPGESPDPIDLTATPRVTFTDPQVAAVGLTESEARAAGYHPRVTTLPVSALARAAVAYRSSGIIKLVADSASDRLLGAHLGMANAGDVIGEAALAIRFSLTTRDLVSTLHPYLTWAEGLKLTARTFAKDPALLSCCA